MSAAAGETLATLLAVGVPSLFVVRFLHVYTHWAAARLRGADASVEYAWLIVPHRLRFASADGPSRETLRAVAAAPLPVWLVGGSVHLALADLPASLGGAAIALLWFLPALLSPIDLLGVAAPATVRSHVTEGRVELSQRAALRLLATGLWGSR